jgi:dTMP kinase
LQRSRQRDAGSVRDRFDRERGEFFERVRAAYLKRAHAEPQRIVIIDAAASMDEVTERITRVLESKSWIS